MTANAIEIEALSKRYRLGATRPGISLREAFASRTQIRHSGLPRTSENVWALKDVSLHVPEGEALGVIGRNGAGKSTLLKILSRITEPTSGVSRTRGRVTALLEVGTGFHPELSGRENIYLNGAILGLTRRQLQSRFEEIVAFAGVERFIDTPVKRYSTGMFLRLAFSVAAHLEADIMAVDEVLAVGDAEFQAKCLGHMATTGRQGRTVVFASHNLDAITQLCPRAVWLERSSIAAIGPTPDVVRSYLASQAEQGSERPFEVDPHGRVSLQAVRVTDGSGRPIDILRRDEAFQVEITFAVCDTVPGLDLSAQVSHVHGIEVLNEAWSDTAVHRPNRPGKYVARFVVPALLAPSDYLIGVWIGTSFETFLHETNAARFRLEGATRGRPRRLIELRLPWRVEEVESTSREVREAIRLR